VYEEQFVKGLSQQQAVEKMETFMQNAMLMIDNHPEMRTIMLSVLCKLTNIRTHNFGRQCFDTLKDLMVAGNELQTQIMDILKKEVIQKFDNHKTANISSQLLKGLQELVLKSGQTNILSALFQNCFAKALRDLRTQMYKKKQAKQEFNNHDYFDAIIGLLSASVQNNDVDNIKLLLTQDLHHMVADIFLESHPNQHRYLDLLYLITAICNGCGSTAPATYFITKYVHRSLMKELKQTYFVYKKTNDLNSTSTTGESADQILFKYKTFAAQIDCLGSMLNSERKDRDSIILEQDQIVFYLMTVTQNFKTDPILLTAICKLTLKVAEQDEVCNSKELIDKVIKNIASCQHLLPYLGMSKYEELLKMVSMYNPSRQATDREFAVQLQYQDDPLVHNLFIAIIKLMSFFCRQLATRKLHDEQPQLTQKYEGVCLALNENSREEALFNCLEVPNDDVRIEVVRCLFNVPLEELDVDEIAQIIKMLSTSNIGAGNTEIVLSYIFWILSKLLCDRESEAGKIFRDKFAADAVLQGLSILKKNQSRLIEDAAEEKEKYTLSLSILNFLKFVSSDESLQTHLYGKSDVLAQILASEQTSTVQMLRVPIDLESTQIGTQILSLRDVIAGKNHAGVQPYNYVSFRVIARMADLLQNN
jgi:hypothetical protein